MKQIYLTGGWGYGNKGDNAILEAMLKTLDSKLKTHSVLLTSYSPKETLKQHKITATPSIHNLLHKRNPLALFHNFAVWLWRKSNHRILLSPQLKKHLSDMGKSDLVVLGGGGYFNDAWRSKLSSIYVEIEMAEAAKTPIMVYGQTVGPFDSNSIQGKLSKKLSSFSKIAYRDIQSLQILEKSLANKNNFVFTADEANLLETCDYEHLNRKTKNKILVGVMTQKYRPHLGVYGPSPTGKIKTSDEYVKQLTLSLTKLSQQVKDIEFLFIPSTTWDEETCKVVFNNLITNGCVATLISDPKADEFIGACQSVDLMISTNMHPIIIASTACKPSIAISYHYKLDDYMNSVGLSEYTVRIDDFTAEELFKKSVDALAQTEVLAEVVRKNHAIVKSRANKNIEAVKEILNTAPSLS